MIARLTFVVAVLLIASGVARCEDSDPTLASFAAGAVTFEYGGKWTASELPRGRQILLVLSRHNVPQSLDDKSLDELTDGIWFAYNPKSHTDGAVEADLAQSIRRDLRRASLGRVEAISLAGVDGWRQGFMLPRRTPLFDAPSAGESEATGQAIQGWRVLLPLETGRIEVHFAAPALKFVERSAELDKLLASAKLGPPQMDAKEVSPALLDAEHIIGAWKSSRGLLELSPQGDVTLSYDREKNYRLDRRGMIDYEKPIKKLTGTYEPQGDLLRIRWKDGSLLNIRWRLAGSELLITDHHGRTERLARVFR